MRLCLLFSTYHLQYDLRMTLHDLNTLPQQQLKEELIKCCGSSTWVNKMLPFFPAEDLVEVLEDAEEQWFLCSETDWKEAFAHHPRIGDTEALQKRFSSTAEWAAGEQSGVNTASPQTLEALVEANKKYEENSVIFLSSMLQGNQQMKY